MGKKRALALFSGGLDSILAAELVRRQGVEVVGLHIKTGFFSEDVRCKTTSRLIKARGNTCGDGR